jgi:hypothetical protein
MNNFLKISNEKMEGIIFLYTGFLHQYQKRFMALEDFILSIFTIANSQSFHTKEHYLHIKYLEFSEKKVKEKLVCLTYFTKKLYIKTETEEDIINWITFIENSKSNYTKFFNIFYEGNKNGIKALDFNEIQSNLNVVEENLKNLVINYELDVFLNKTNFLSKKFVDYLNELNSVYHKLNEVNVEEHFIKSKLKELRSLMSSLNVKYSEKIGYTE